jgi:molybdate transport system substrate-binding protein
MPTGRTTVGGLVALMVALAACGDTGDGGEGAGSGMGDGGASTGSGTVQVLAAASLTDAFEEMAGAFEAAHRGVDVTFSFAGSSALVQQVADGAPADVVATADQRTMRRLVEEADGSLRGDPQVFARNHLALVVPAGNPGEVSGLADLADGDLFVGLCAAEVPCGHLSAEVLASEGVTAEVDSYEPDVRSLLTKLVAGELDAGLVYRTDAEAAGDDVEVVAVPGLQERTTSYPIVALDTGADPAGGGAFVAFVLSDEGQDILRRHGFTAP